jgi:hypothetical protein
MWYQCMEKSLHGLSDNKNWFYIGSKANYALRQIMLTSVLHSPALAMISCCAPKQNATHIDSEIDNIRRSNKFL